ncbi:uncharacterized protein LOC124416137 [Diprion similis]|uniref:uncharacterized protein LOC124416137 n=1 Tax=Diprion similis TaxID=362088 RepID=UPI001EF998B1|nr:uncharacterized protein LOC124416137 [Diprion similis]
MKCACCYAKWKGSLPDTEQSRFPDFSFLVDSESELTPENAAKSESNLLKVMKVSGQDQEQEKHKHGNCEKKNKPHGISGPFVKNSKSGNTVQAFIVQTAMMTNDTKPSTLEPEPKMIVSSDRNTDSFLGKSEYPHSSRSEPSKRAARAMGLKSSKRALSMKVGQQPRNASYPIDRRSRLSRKSSVKKIADKSMRAKAKPFAVRISSDQIDQWESYKGSSSFSSLNNENVDSERSKKPDSKIALKDDESSPMCQFKPWKASHDPGYLDPDRIILRRMTNPQRILVGQMCASLKTRKINMEGLVREKTPLAALIAPVFSNEIIRILTKGIRGVGSRKREVAEENDEDIAIVSEKLTGPVLARIRQAVAENETQRKLHSFLKSQL